MQLGRRAYRQEIIDFPSCRRLKPNDRSSSPRSPQIAPARPYTGRHSRRGSGGIGLVEVVRHRSGPGSSILNISTGGDVGRTGDNVMIGAFIISGGVPSACWCARSAVARECGVTDPLGDPTLTPLRQPGNTARFQRQLAGQIRPKSEIEATTIPPSDPNESASCQLSRRAATPRFVRGAALSRRVRIGRSLRVAPVGP